MVPLTTDGGALAEPELPDELDLLELLLLLEPQAAATSDAATIRAAALTRGDLKIISLFVCRPIVAATHGRVVTHL
jgi:hypothetical protein